MNQQKTPADRAYLLAGCCEWSPGFRAPWIRTASVHRGYHGRLYARSRKLSPTQNKNSIWHHRRRPNRYRVRKTSVISVPLRRQFSRPPITDQQKNPKVLRTQIRTPLATEHVYLPPLSRLPFILLQTLNEAELNMMVEEWYQIRFNKIGSSGPERAGKIQEESRRGY